MKLFKIIPGLVVLLLFTGVLAQACSLVPPGGQDVDPTTGLIQTIPPATLTAISAAAEKSQPPDPNPMGIPWSSLNGLKLDFWYIWDLDEPGIGMNAIVDRFNLDNEWGITVSAFDQGLTHDPLDSIDTAFQDGVVPQIMISDASLISAWYQAGLTVDLTPFLEDPAVGLSLIEQHDYYPDIFEPFILDGSIRPGIPFTQSIQVLYYNQSWAGELGLTQVPGTSAEVIKQACRASKEIHGRDGTQNDSSGIILYPDAANLTSWIYAYQGVIQDPANHRFIFSSQEVKEVAFDWLRLGQQDCGGMISQFPNPMAREIEFDLFNQRGALLMMNSAQNFDQIKTGANLTGRADQWIMLPFIGPDGEKAAAAKIQSGVIFKTTPEEELAAWLFLKYLTSPEVQAEWVQYSAGYPTRKESLRFLRDYRTANPGWAQGLNLLKYSRAEPLDPSWDLVQLALGDAFEAILTGESQDPDSILADLDQTAAELWKYSRQQ